MKQAGIYKNYIEPIIVFSPILVLIALMQYKTKNFAKFPEWYKMSIVIQNIFEHGIHKSKVFTGNSYVQSGVRPEIVISDKKESVYVFARGNTPSIELMLWLYKHEIFPDVIVAELNTRHLLPQYFADFDIILPDSDEKFDLLKNKIEIYLRYYLERKFSFLTYRTTPKDALYIITHSRSFKNIMTSLFIPVSAYRKEVDFSPFGYTSIPEKPGKNFNVRKKTKKYTVDYIKKVKSSAPNIQATLELWNFLTKKFRQHGTDIILLRLPKSDMIIAGENRLAPEYFVGLRKLAEKNDLKYLDLTTPEYINDFRNCFIDGAHWNNSGAKRLSELLSRIIQ